MIKCTNCGFDQIPDGALRCPQCSFPIGQPIPASPGVPQGPVIQEQIPWKKRDSLGLPQAFIENVKEVFTNPMAFFQKVRNDEDWMSPILYLVIIAWISGFFSFFWSLFLPSPLKYLPFFKNMDAMSSARMATSHVFAFFGTFVFAPLWYVIVSFIWAGLVHVAALVFGDGENGFETTYKTLAYASTAGLIGIIPICGPPVGVIVSIVFAILAMKQAHQTETWKAVMSVLVWVLLGLVCCGIGLLMTGLAAASFLHSSGAQ